MWWMAPPTASSSAVQAVVDDRAVVGEKHRGDHRFARLLLLLCEHGVEAADGVRFQSRHRAAAIQNKNQFRHKKSPPSFDYAHIVAHPKEGLVACGATFMFDPELTPNIACHD